MEDSGHIPVWREQRVERTNARGRHTYCAPFKAWIVGQALRPGMSMAGLAMRNQVNANQLRRWVMLHQRAWPGPKQGLLPVTIAPEAALAARPLQSSERIEIMVADVVVRVPMGAEATTLRTVLEVLRGMAR
jgi:transposase-like protein